MPAGIDQLDLPFDHASIPNRVTKHFIGDFAQRSPRRILADTILDLRHFPEPHMDNFGFQPGLASTARTDDNGQARDDRKTVTIQSAPHEPADLNRQLWQLLFDHIKDMCDDGLHFPPEQQAAFDESRLQAASEYMRLFMSKVLPRVMVTEHE
jgi:hypothetical protein